MSSTKLRPARSGSTGRRLSTRPSTTSFFPPPTARFLYEPDFLFHPPPSPGPPPRATTAALSFLNVSLELFNGFRSPAQMRPLIALEQGLGILDELARAARSA